MTTEEILASVPSDKAIIMKSAMAKYANPWWESEDSTILFLGQIQEKKLLIPFKQFHKATQEALGRPVWTHEFALPKELLEEWQGKIPAPNMDEIVDKIRKINPDIPIAILSTQ